MRPHTIAWSTTLVTPWGASKTFRGKARLMPGLPGDWLLVYRGPTLHTAQLPKRPVPGKPSRRKRGWR